MFRRLMDRWWLGIVLGFAAAAVALGAFLPGLGFGASTEDLLGERDPDLRYYDATRPLWRSDDEFAIVWCRRADWFTPEGVALLRELQTDVERVPHCARVESVLSIPLLRNSPAALMLRPKLDGKSVDLAKAREELVHHAVAGGTLVSTDGRDVVFLAYLARPEGFDAVEKERRAALSAGDTARVQSLADAYEAGRAEVRARRVAFVDGLRALAARWDPRLDEPVALSGLPIINVNLVEHVRHDVFVFLVLSLALFTLAFAVVYRRVRWTVLPIVTCLLPVVLVLGTMSLLGRELTVVTANLPMLVFVVMLPYTVYLIERYRERRAVFAEETHRDSMAGAARDVWPACLCSCTTTMAGFFSLWVTSDVNPVVWFGGMMTVGLAVGLGCAFLFFPAAVHPLRALESEGAGRGTGKPHGLVRWAERVVLGAPGVVAAGGAVLLAVSIWGTSRIDVENKFIDYFHAGSEIHRGLARIDERMGGTTPLDVVLTSEEPGYFKTEKGLAAIAAASRYFETVPEAGAVWSVGMLLAEGRKSLPNLTVEALSRIKEVEPLLRDVATPDFSTTRILVRFHETAPTLNRNRILAGLRAHLAKEPALAEVTARPTGVFLLYANMLDALIRSQRDTFLLVVAAIYSMLAMLFGAQGIARVVRGGPGSPGAEMGHALVLSLVVLVPQVIPALVCLGVMGFAGVPLDLITVMVAAVAMGVGIDAAIQYTVRYRAELAATGGDRRGAVTRSHATIGRAIWIATSIMVAGFLVLWGSDFVPTVYFGLFNALAMLMGQLAALTVLPALFLLTGYPRR